MTEWLFRCKVKSVIAKYFKDCVITSLIYLLHFNCSVQLAILLTLRQIYERLSVESIGVSQTTPLNPSIGPLGK